MNLPSLPLDILLEVFRDLDAIDIVRAGVTCKALYEAVHDRYIWINQLEKSHKKNPALRTSTPALTSLSAQELKTLVTRPLKLRHRWTKDDGQTDFATKGLAGVPGICRLRLLPGGKSLIFINARGNVILRRIKSEDGQVSLPIVASIDYNHKIIVGPGWSKLLTAMSPCPILLHKQGTDMNVLRVDHYNDAMSLATTVEIPEGCTFRAHGQGRTVGFLVRGPTGSPKMRVIHLDYPGVIVESTVFEAVFTLWSFCIPTEGLAILFNTQDIIAYKIPDFSKLSPGINVLNASPVWYRLNVEQVDGNPWIWLSYMTSEAPSDPSSAQGANLHYVCRERAIGEGPFAITVTVPINNNDPAPGPTGRIILKHKFTAMQNYGWDSSALSCTNGLHSNKAILKDKIEILVTPLDDLVLEDGRGTLRMSASYQELGFKWPPRTIDMDMDEITGRVIIWGWDKDAYETKVFVGDLV